MKKLFKSSLLPFRKKRSTEPKPKRSLKTRLSVAFAHWNIRKIVTVMLVLAVGIGSVSGWYWYGNIYMTPERRLTLSLENSMRTPSVVRSLSEGGSGNQVVQEFRFHFAPQRVIENRVDYVLRNATTNRQIVTEGIVFPQEQYLKFSTYRSTEQGEPEVSIDELLGQWAKESTLSDEEESQTYLSEQVSLVVFGNFPSKVRNEFIQRIKTQGIYTIDYSSTFEQDQDGEKVIVYPVSVKLREYATLLNDSFKAAGYGEFAPLDPSNYREDARVQAQFKVRKKDNAVVGVAFGGREEVYGGYGIVKTVEVPEAKLTIDELQTKIQELLETQ